MSWYSSCDKYSEILISYPVLVLINYLCTFCLPKLQCNYLYYLQIALPIIFTECFRKHSATKQISGSRSDPCRMLSIIHSKIQGRITCLIHKIEFHISLAYFSTLKKTHPHLSSNTYLLRLEDNRAAWTPLMYLMVLS